MERLVGHGQVVRTWKGWKDMERLVGHERLE